MLREVSLLLVGSVLTFSGKWLNEYLQAASSQPGVRGGDSVSPRKGAPDASAWDSLRALLQVWELTQNYAVAIGDAKYGRLFVYEGGNFTMKTKIPTGSTSKWPSAMMFAGLVNDGTISSLDDPVHKYLSWWTKDAKDLRSTVTFRMLLSFTSGFGDGHPGEYANTRAGKEWRRKNKPLDQQQPLRERRLASTACDTQKGEVTKCAQWIYNNVKLIGTPGEVYSYNSNHLQIAAAVAVAATGFNIKRVIHKYLLVPYKMSDSFYAGNCPDFGGSLVTTGADYEKFMYGLLSYTTLEKSIIDASEEDSTPFLKDYYTLYGDYGFGHFLMCFDSYAGFTNKCKQAKCHMDPGAFGFIPIIDRKYGYYMEVVSAEIAPTGDYALSGIPEYLAVAIKPHIDAIMSGESLDPMEFNFHTPKYLSMTVADVNYCVNCKLNPKSCS
jgi:CubicO group peptidase (beta-lactamase class C family)